MEAGPETLDAKKMGVGDSGWAQNNPSSKRFFYALSLEEQSGTALSGYIASKGYLDFATANNKLGNGTGFRAKR